MHNIGTIIFLDFFFKVPLRVQTPETLTEWKTETESDQWTDQPTGAGARDAYA